MSGSRAVLHRVRERVRWFLRVQKLEDRLQDLEARVGRLEGDDRLLPPLLAAHDDTRQRARHADDLTSELVLLGDDLASGLNRHELRLEYFDRLAQVEAVSAWIDAVPPRHDPTVLISVVLPTRNRGHLVPRAIDTVLRQRYADWELVVVDDGSTDDTPTVLASYDDPRVRTVRTSGLGLAGARNTGLDHATGDVVVYLDDDNLMHPGWLRAVAWGFTEHPDTDVLYAARLIDDEERLHHREGRALPSMHFERYDRTRLLEGNIADVGVVAHRRDLAEARFDASLDYHEDWDLFLRLTADREPLELPVLSILYTTEAPGRLTDVVDESVHHAPPPGLRRGDDAEAGDA